MGKNKSETDKLKSKHHYVPRSYLRRFSHNNKGKIYAYESGGPGFLVSINDIASEKGFYNYELEGRWLSGLENDLAEIDSRGASVLSRLDRESPGVLPENLNYKRNLIDYVAIQYLRTPRHRGVIAKAMGELATPRAFNEISKFANNKQKWHDAAKVALKKEGVQYEETEVEGVREKLLTNDGADDLNFRIEFNSAEQYFMGASFLMGYPLIDELLSKKMLLLEAKGKKKFITSDSPASLYCPTTKSPAPLPPLVTATLQFPVSPGRILIFSNNVETGANPAISDAEVAWHNSQTAKAAVRFIFSRRKLDQDDERNLLDDLGLPRPALDLSGLTA